MFSPIEDAIEDIRSGKMVIVCDDEDRENEGDLVMAADMVMHESVNFMARFGRGLICVPISEAASHRLGLPVMPKRNSKDFDCNFTMAVDAVSVGTGISAHERAETIKKLADPESSMADFRQPGHVFPLVARDGGVLVRAGHTEAAVDLARLAGLSPAGVICEIMNDDGTMARSSDLKVYAQEHGLKMITIKDLIEYRYHNENLVKREVETKIPTELGEFKLVAYSNIIDSQEHVAITYGEIDYSLPVLVRVHSECFTGDILGSLRCDCQAQLHKSLDMIVENGSGIVLYMRQEGRGIGLINKLRTYNLQDQGMDTVEANHALGFGDDLRHYGIGAQILADLGVRKMKLMTNNPCKIVGIEGYGIEVVDRVPIEIDPVESNKDYLATKKAKLGHLLDLV